MPRNQITPVLLALAVSTGVGFADDPFLEAMDGDKQGVREGLYGLQQDLRPGFQDLTTAQAEKVEGRVFTKEGRRYIRVRPEDTLASVAQEAYGDANLWYLIYFHNQHYLAAKEKGDTGEVVLYLPPSPRERARVVDGQRLVMAIPGDTYQGLASQLYGTTSLDTHIASANLDRIPNQADPHMIFKQPPEMLSRVLVAPPPPTSGGSNGLPNANQPIDWASVPRSGAGPSGVTVNTSRSGMPASGTTGGAGPRPSASEASSNPIRSSIRDLQLSGPSQIGEREARVVLEAAGFFHQRIQKKHMPPARTPLEAAMRAMYWGNTYKRPTSSTNVTLDARMQGWIFEQYTQLRESLGKYQGWSHISQRHRPQEYEAWINAASGQLTNVPAGQRAALMRSLMQTETAKTHWEGYQPVISHSGAVGFGQFLPATARDLGINPYDPAQNIQGIAKYVNNLIAKARRAGHSNPLRRALAEYNGGNKPPSSSYAYADGIIRRVA